MRKRRRSGGPALPLTGSIAMPGDKSISHRALILSALAEGSSRIHGLNPGDDVRATADALGRLGVSVGLEAGNALATVEGHGWAGLREPTDVIDARNSGTTLRTLAGVCAALPAATVLTGDETLRARPMLRIVSPLRQMGATVDGARHGDRPPLFVRGGSLDGVDLELPVASAQVKTCVLLAGLRARGRTSVAEPGTSRDHTERMLAAAGVAVEAGSGSVSVAGDQQPAPVDWEVPGDISGAMFFIVAATLIEGSDLTIEDVGLNPTRTGLLGVLRAMGADIEITAETEHGGEPRGVVRVRHAPLHSIDTSPEDVPSFVDEIPILAVAATQATGRTVIRGAAELRVKESDRLAAMAGGLRSIGASVEETPDGLVIDGPAALTGGTVDSRGDHRIAMAFAVAGLIAPANVRVEGWSAVDTSFPDFLDVLGRAQGRVGAP